MKLDGKVALVTGGGRGIGAAISRALAREGARVAVNYNASKRDAERLAEEINGIAVRADVSKEGDVERMVSVVARRFGRPDILVNNAGMIEHVSSFAEITPEMWDRMMAVNARSVFLCTKAIAPGMLRKGWGRIINISSTAQLVGRYPALHYSASKAAIDALTKSFANQLAPKILVNAVAPGFIDTNLRARYTSSELEKIKKEIPLRRFGSPEEVADAVLFLCSATYMTGQTLILDGGRAGR
mgnify:CR=1 FL=1